MNRLDVYTAVHKMQRARLFALTVEAGKLDSSDAIAVAQLAAAVRALVEELRAHAAHEDQFIHPVLRTRVPEMATELDAAHVALDARLEQLRQVASTAALTPDAPNALYRALASLTGIYLGHLALEEEQALPALWEGCTDDELFGILTAFKSSRSDIENLTSVVAQMATLNPTEIAGMVRAGLGSVPASAVAELLATLLDPRQLGALRQALAVDVSVA